MNKVSQIRSEMRAFVADIAVAVRRLLTGGWQSLLVILVIAVALSIPLIFFGIANNITQQVPTDAQQGEVTLLLKSQYKQKHAETLRQRIVKLDGVADIVIRTPKQALEDFQQRLGIDDLAELLGDNPLPYVITARIADSATPRQIDNLLKVLESDDRVEQLVYDRLWLQRLAAIVKLVMIGAAILGGLMVFGAVLLIYNLTNMGVTERHREIDVLDQVGATRAYIRRPFLQQGVLTVAMATLTAVLIANFAIWVVGQYAGELASLYAYHFSVSWLPWTLIIGLLLGTCVLAWFVARIAVDQHLIKRTTSA